MGVTVYKSTDASAPVLTGQVGTLVALLDAVLVNGYGSQTAAGWTIAYTATNKRDYKQGTGSNGFYLDIDDSGPGAAGAREARMRGYETMTALATGTNPFPTTAQISSGCVARKSTTADATARPWTIVADATCFYLFMDTGDYTLPNYAISVMFGDFFSYKSSDAYSTIIIGRSTENNGINGGAETFPVLTNSWTGSMLSTTLGGHFVTRNTNGIAGSVACGKIGGALCGTNSNGSHESDIGGNYSVLPYPNTADNAMELSPIWIVHGSMVRGYLKGLWAPGHRQPCGHWDTFSGTGNMAGKSFQAFNMTTGIGYWGNGGGQAIMETSNTWS